jgi:hypothetical protein
LKDLTFIDDGNRNTLDGMINFRKRFQLMESINGLLSYQKQSYKLMPVEPIYTFLDELPVLDDRELYQISIGLEEKKQ